MITRSEIESEMRKLPANKIPGTDGFTEESYQWYKELTLSLLNSFKRLKRKKHSQSHSKKSPSPWHQNQKKTLRKKENYRQISLMNTDAKILSKVLADQIQQHIQKIIHHDQVGSILTSQGWFSIPKSIDEIHCINKWKDKTT